MYATASATRIKAARRLTTRALRERERAFLAEGPQAWAAARAWLTEALTHTSANGKNTMA